MENPFELIIEKLARIEKAIEMLSSIQRNTSDDSLFNVEDVSKYLKVEKSAIYKFTSTNEIPHYKNGKKLYFKKSDIDKWISSKKIKTRDDIEREALEYLIKNPKRF